MFLPPNANPANARTSYLPDSSRTDVTGAGGGGMGGGGNLQSLIEEMIRRRMNPQQKPRSPFGRASARTARSVGGASSGPGGEGDRTGALKQRMMEAQLQQEQAKARALSGRIPTKLHPGGAGFTSAFQTPDHLAMTGAQRQFFLPGNSEQRGGFGEGGGGGRGNPVVRGGPFGQEYTEDELQQATNAAARAGRAEAIGAMQQASQRR